MWRTAAWPCNSQCNSKREPLACCQSFYHSEIMLLLVFAIVFHVFKCHLSLNIAAFTVHISKNFKRPLSNQIFSLYSLWHMLSYCNVMPQNFNFWSKGKWQKGFCWENVRNPHIPFFCPSCHHWYYINDFVISVAVFLVKATQFKIPFGRENRSDCVLG